MARDSAGASKKKPITNSIRKQADIGSSKIVAKKPDNSLRSKTATKTEKIVIAKRKPKSYLAGKGLNSGPIKK